MYRKPVPLEDRHGVSDFDSGKPALDAFLKDMALHNQIQGYTRTFVIADADFRVVGYHSLCAGMISREHAPRQVKGHRAPGEIPVALLARLAVDRRHQGQGLGGELLKNALLAVIATAEVIAFRAVMVHALDEDAERFYLRYGFRQAKGLERTLLLPVKDILASLGG
ncbi:GNAT family N-acetyltransferase [Rhizobium sp. XQZ8]|uniref:GNAT family N-acetyltransferase n=1 Tax=Rhizobium populisoli TaxID=2859785 RepID=UPI001C663AB8|nr:GNAT family N-acetyltransferase [Rhizobium populisoli]MBW6421263.1 GNAT family N-acetyltransferase [Rhizobium populisoli]